MCITNGKKQSEAQRSKPKTIGGMYEGCRYWIGEMRSRLTDTVATDLMSWLIARSLYIQIYEVESMKDSHIHTER